MNDNEASKFSFGLALLSAVLVLAIIWIPELQGNPGLRSCLKQLPCNKDTATVQAILCGLVIIGNVIQAAIFNLL